jgi:hypothetical protein
MNTTDFLEHFEELNIVLVTSFISKHLFTITIVTVAIHCEHWNVACPSVNYDNRLKPELLAL